MKNEKKEAASPAGLALCSRQPGRRWDWAISGGSRTWRPNTAAGSFLLIYMVLALTFGYTMIMAETRPGPHDRAKARSAPTPALPSRASAAGSLGFGGWINAIIPVLIVPYYSVIGGWVIRYLVEYLARPTARTLAAGRLLLRSSLPDGAVGRDVLPALCGCSRWASSLRVCATALSASPR